jgi:hypothetical protein
MEGDKKQVFSELKQQLGWTNAEWQWNNSYLISTFAWETLPIRLRRKSFDNWLQSTLV